MPTRAGLNASAGRMCVIVQLVDSSLADPSCCWLLSSNVRIEILCREDVARRIVEMIVTRYSDNFGLVVYMLDVQTRRSDKF